MKDKKSTYHQKKYSKLLMTWDCFKHNIKMEYQKITNLLDTTPDNVPRFITKKLMEVHDQSGSAENRYNPSKETRLKTSMLRSDLCDFSDAYIVVKGTITVTDPNDDDAYDKKIAFKNNGPFVSCISKINNRLVGNAEDLDIVILMYNLIEYSKNFSKATGSFWNYYIDEPNSGLGGANSNIVDRTSFSKYYVPNVQTKDFNVLIDGKSFFGTPIKNDEETYKQIIEMGRNNDYMSGNFLDYKYFSKHYKLTAIDLSKQIELENPDLKQ